MRLIAFSVLPTLMLLIVADLRPYLATSVAAAQEIAESAQTPTDKPVKPSSTVFILDCSYSMSEEFDRGAGFANSFSRFEAASKALESVLVELSERDGPERPKVGVWLFGHRVAWVQSPQLPPQLKRNPSAADRNPIPRDLPPAEDVERILRLGGFGPRELGIVRERLRRVQPLGITPLNLAIIRALDEFDGGGGNSSKRIVVITDGENDQWHSTEAGFRPIVPVSEDSVIHGWKRLNMPIPIFIVDFEKPGAVRAGSRIADATGGKVLRPANRADLVKSLRDLVMER